MTNVVRAFRSFDRPSQVLMVNQFAINLGFYMLMPYLAGYLAGPMGFAAWTVGLVLGLRNFSQQGMFLIGGTLADRLGYKPLIIAGCLLRTGGFFLLAMVSSLPAILVAAAATGFAGALFNPAVRAYLAADSGERRVEAFALFNVFYQAGILAGPLVGLALMTFDFKVTAMAAAIVFLVLSVLQVAALPARPCEPSPPTSVWSDWRTIIGNRPFVLFSLAMIGSYVLTFQIYLALPLQAAVIVGPTGSESVLVSALFVVSGLVAIAGQLRITAWFTARWGPTRSLPIGMLTVAASFAPLVAIPNSTTFGPWPAAAALVLTAVLLAVGTAAVFPFEMNTVVALAHNRLVATHYGLYNTIVGTGILVGNLGTGAIFGLLQGAGFGWLIWLILTAVGLVCAAALWGLYKAKYLEPSVKEEAVTVVAAS